MDADTERTGPDRNRSDCRVTGRVDHRQRSRIGVRHIRERARLRGGCRRQHDHPGEQHNSYGERPGSPWSATTLRIRLLAYPLNSHRPHRSAPAQESCHARDPKTRVRERRSPRSHATECERAVVQRDLHAGFAYVHAWRADVEPVSASQTQTLQRMPAPNSRATPRATDWTRTREGLPRNATRCGRARSP